MIGRAKKKKNRFSGDTARMSGVDDVPSEFTSSALSSSSGEQPTQQPPTWFAGLRSKLALFSMSDWFSQLGLGRPATPTRRCSDDVVASAYSNASSPLRQQQQQRARSMGPTVCFDESPATEGEDDPLTPTGDDDVNPWNLPSFWLNLEPGRNYNDTLELQHFGPLDNLVTIGKHAPGQGHTFEQLHLVHPTWCDKCGDFIWGFLKQAVRCENCNYTCHYKCRLLVTLDCRSARDSIKSNETAASYLTAKSTKSQTLTLPNEPNPSDSADDEIDPMDTIDTKSIHQVYVNQDPFEWPEAFQGDRLRKMVQEYNDSADGLSITVHEDGVNFSGYLQIHMNFTRPINVVAGERPPSVYDVINTGTGTMDNHRTITSFFLPRNTVKTLHVSSSTTTRQLIVSLLRKFKVADNPRKFALYERIYEQEDGTQTFLRKMIRIADDVCPLRLALSWGSAKKGRQFVLQENDTGDILWDAFEIPELENFLRILEMEEQQYAWQIKQRFNLYRHYLELELKERGEIVSMASIGEDSLSDAKADMSDLEKLSDLDVFPPPPTSAQLAFLDTMKPGDTVNFRDPKSLVHLTAKTDRSSNTSTDSSASWRFGTL